MKPFSLVPVVGLVVTLSASSVAAQAPPSPQGGFGTDLQVLTIPPVAFLPHNSDQQYFTSCCQADSHRRPTAAINRFYASLDSGSLPNGALIERVDFFVRDNDPGANAEISGQLCRTWIAEDGSQFGGTCPDQATSAGAPGDTVLSVSPHHTVRYDDFDGDAIPEFVSYMLVVDFGINGSPTFTSNLRLRGARILYRRQVSPAPATATFNDVPAGHPFFRFVEALAASGITAGCGGGNYCPDNALTRGQMAVFLAKALGLHWPGPPLPPS